MRWRTVINRVGLPVAILVFYFVIPIGSREAPIGETLGFLLGGLSVTAVAWVIVDEARRAETQLRPIHLLIAYEVVLVGFSLGYFVIATTTADQFDGMVTRLDALYFSMTTTATVGYGDITAIGQFARGAVTTQMAFNLLFVASLVAIIQDMVKRADRQLPERGPLRRHLRAHDAEPQRPDPPTEK